MADVERANLERATKSARELLESHGVQQPPVDVDAIAKAEGVQVVYEELEDRISGILVQKDDATIIGVNKLHHAHRQRFTLAHELGHYTLHPHNPTVWVDDLMVHFRGENMYAPATPEEVEANAFAATLLMPEEFLKHDLAGRVIDVLDEVAVRRLAQRYRVSPQALTIRLMELGLLAGLPPSFARLK
jgi:Zn-dependent peptidase ImmA (M78 family)